MLTGKVGKFNLEGNTVGEYVTGNLTVDRNVVDTTPVGQLWASGNEIGKSWAFDFTMNYDPANTAQAAILAAMATTGDSAFTTVGIYGSAAGHSWLGSAKLTTAGITKAVGSVDQLTGNFMGNGVLTYTA